MNFQEVLSQARQGRSDTKFSKAMGVSRPALTKWENGSIPKDELLDKLADEANIKREVVYFIAYAEKTSNPTVAEELRKLAKH